MGWPVLLLGVMGCGPLSLPCEPLPTRRVPLIERHFNYAATMPAPLRTRVTAPNSLQFQDRAAIRRNQADEKQVSGPVDLTFSAVRVAGGPGGTDSLWRSDRYTMLSLGASAAIQLGGVQVRATLANASIRRRRDVMPTPARRLSTDMTSAGIDVSQGGGPTLGIDYLRIGRSQGRRVFDGPEVNNVGGVAAGQGVRLTLGDDQLSDGGPTMGWRVSLSSLHRPLADPLSRTGDYRDAQAEARWTITF